MSKKKNTFQIGNPGGPGRPPLPPEVKAARALTKVKLEATLNKFLHMNKEELADYKNNPDATVLELMVHAITHKAILSGDTQRLDFLLNRLIGKVADQVESQGTIDIRVHDYRTKELK